jgi:spore germination protein GerM
MKHPSALRFFIVMLSLTAILAISACAAKEQTHSGTTANGGAAAKEGQSNTTEKTEQISIYVTDDDMTALIERKTEIRYSDEKEKLEAAFAALQKEGIDGKISLWKNANLLSVKSENGAVTFDLHLPDNARFGAPGEELALEAIKQTMFQFDEVKSIDLLVDGEQTDSLMGHEELDHPIMKP